MDQTLEPNIHATEGLNPQLREMDCFLLFMKFLRERSKCILILCYSRTTFWEPDEGISKFLGIRSTAMQVPWNMAGSERKSYLIYFRTIGFLLLALFFLSCSQHPYIYAHLHAQGQWEERHVRCFRFCLKALGIQDSFRTVSNTSLCES